MAFDFSNAQLPRLLPLENSYVENEVEADLKRLFLHLFTSALAPALFDVNVLGMAHLGSFELVRRAVNSDGLVLLQGDGEEASTRYLYRAWKAGDTQGRGLHFLRTYLQLLFPNIGTAVQLWHGKTSPYPSDVREESGVDAFLTSRVRITINSFPDPEKDDLVRGCLPSVMPARLVPSLRHQVTSNIGKMRLIAVGSGAQNWHVSGALDLLVPMEGTAQWVAAGHGNPAQLLNARGTIA
ncbi:hypothetical protein [Burkholderia plantarii]|uniref:Uncharacterized protein n=1 Tax=Burkholderia plantarii TaxID=41899 RepID=A0A0B6RYW0_BURPL|nr:hypothetical protein [Burkholderia plantarii]AJK46255.1 hypothetical protein BGL_1c17460 [Burkholderia plantarii]